MTLTQIKPAGLSKPVALADNERIRLGTGNDLQIYHTGSQANIRAATGQGSLWITGDQIELINGAVSENMLIATQNAAVKLYYDNSKKFETTSAGATLTGNFSLTGSISMAANKYIAGSSGIDFYGDGSDAGDKLVQLIDGGFRLKDSRKIEFGNSQDLQIYHDGSHSYIQDAGTGHLYFGASGYRFNNQAQTESIIQANENGAVELYYDGVIKFETMSTGVDVHGTLRADEIKLQGDNQILKIGGADDLQLYHSGQNSIINNNVGDLRLESDIIELLNHDSNEFYLRASNGGAVDLYYDNVKKAQTDSTGFNVPNYPDYLSVGSNGNTASGRFGYQDNYKLYIENVRGTHTKVIWDNDGKIRSQISDGSNLQDRFEVNTSGAILSGNLLPDANDTRNLGNNATRWDGVYGTYVSAKHTTANTSTNAEFRNEHSVYGGGVRFKSNNTYGTLELTNYSGSAAATLVNTTGGWHWSHNLILGSNIAFNGETSNANELDDYEEGTWTPDLTRWTGSAWWSNTWDTAPSTNTGLYTKVGRVVYITFDIAGFDVGSATDGKYVGMNGLPFAATTTNGNAGQIVVTYSSNVFETDTATSFWVSNGGTTTTSNRFGDDNGSHNTYSSGSGKRLRGNGFYFTNT